MAAHHHHHHHRLLRGPPPPPRWALMVPPAPILMPITCALLLSGMPTRGTEGGGFGTPPPASAGAGKPPHGLGLCLWMPLVNGTGNSPVSMTADPRSSQTGQVIRGLR